MSFFRKLTKEARMKKEESKIMFEKKFCLGKCDPDPSFDLSGCGLETVPSAVFKFVRVLRKTALLFQKNELTSFGTEEDMRDLELLESLILSSNKLTTLPYSINFLKFLKVLDVSNNQLVSLPDSMCELSNLEAVNLSSNKLSKLPNDMGKLTKLLQINVENNSGLKALPVSLHHLPDLVEISWSPNQHFTLPPQGVMSLGVAQILTFLAKECNCGCDIYSNKNCLPGKAVESALLPAMLQHREMEAKLKIQEEERAVKGKEKLAFEEAFLKRQQSELLTLMSAKEERNKMLRVISQEQSQLENRLKRLHLAKEAERSELLLCLKEAERLSNSVIEELLARNSRMWSREQKLCQDEEDKRLQEHLLKTQFEKSQAYRKEAIYEAMYDSLLSNQNLKKLICDQQAATSKVQNKLLKREERMNEKLGKLLSNRSAEQKELMKSIERDEELQESAVSALLEESDVQTFRLVHEIQCVEKQLAQVTQLELEQNRLAALTNIEAVCKKREALSQLLEELLKLRDERRQQLLSTVNLLQNDHLRHDSTPAPDYWLRQYQHLLELLPGSLMKAQQLLDPRLVHHLTVADVIHCLPFVAHCANSSSIRDISDQDLRNSGAVLGSDRAKVLEAIQNFISEIEMPLAPPLNESASSDSESTVLPSAPPINECVVCFENEISIVFVDCGHCCCCDTCAVPLTSCPLCRTVLHSKVKLFMS